MITIPFFRVPLQRISTAYNFYILPYFVDKSYSIVFVLLAQCSPFSLITYSTDTATQTTCIEFSNHNQLIEPQSKNTPPARTCRSLPC